MDEVDWDAEFLGYQHLSLYTDRPFPTIYAKYKKTVADRQVCTVIRFPKLPTLRQSAQLGNRVGVGDGGEFAQRRALGATHLELPPQNRRHRSERKGAALTSAPMPKTQHRPPIAAEM